MELEEMKQAWQRMGARIDEMARGQAELRLAMQKTRAADPLRRTSALMGYELVGNCVILLLLGLFIARQDQWRFIAPALMLYPLSLANFVTGVVQRVVLARLDYGERVLVIQKRLEMLWKLRWRMAQVNWLLMPLLWVPLMIVLARWLGGDFYAAGATWLGVNVALGIAAIPVGWALARYLAPTLQRTAIGRWFVDSTVGLGLAETRRRTAELARFERP